ADGGDALFGHAIGGLVGRDAVAVGDLEDLADVVVDATHHAHGALAVVAVELDADVHQAAGIHGVVRRVDQPAAGQLVADLVGSQLVVGGTADHLGLDPVQGALVDRAAQRAGAVDVDVAVVDVIEAHGFAAVFVDAALHGFLVDVGDEHLGTGIAQQLHILEADMAHALHGVAVLANVLVAVLLVQRGQDRKST